MSADRPPRPLRVCYFGAYRAEYSRNRIMIEGLRRAGAEVVECHAPLWTSIEDRVQAVRGGWASLSFVRRALSAYMTLLRLHRQVGDYDVLMAGYPGQFDVYLARLLAWRRRKPLAWDIFMSIYLIALERGLGKANSLTVAALRWVEWGALRLPNLLICDTREYAQWYGRTHGIAPERFQLAPTGADERVFAPAPARAPDGLLRVVYHGSFIPNHGVPYILQAARCLAGAPEIQFEMIGAGPDEPDARAFAAEARLPNVTFSGWLEPEELARRAGQADVILGAFGQTPQSLMTVQNKIYQGLALARVVVSGDGPAVRAALTHHEHIWLVDRSRPADLAAALQALHADPARRARLAQAGHAVFLERYTTEAIGRQALAHLEALVTLEALRQ